jgi:hypothetical protein
MKVSEISSQHWLEYDNDNTDCNFDTTIEEDLFVDSISSSIQADNNNFVLNDFGQYGGPWKSAFVLNN